MPGVQFLLPRKGTETTTYYRGDGQVQVQFLLPRKGTETGLFFSADCGSISVQFLLPRKGTETSQARVPICLN